MRDARAWILGLAVVLAASSPAWPWGCEGHEVVALVAKKHLTAKAAVGVKGLVGTPSTVIGNIHRFCSIDRSLDPMANVSTWADDVRKSRPSTAPWHFLDVPRGSQRADVPSSCPSEGCVTKAITEQLAILNDTHATKKPRAEALMFIIHLVGDLHQPLHCADCGFRPS